MITIVLAVTGVAAAGLAAANPCVPVRSERIPVRDFAPALPPMAAAPPEAMAGFSPMPGARRIFSPAEVASLAARYEIALPEPAAVCFEYPVSQIDPARLTEPMQRALPNARIEIVESTKIPAPEGEVEFPRQGLSLPTFGSTAPVVWRGFIRYGQYRRFPIWARVRIRAPMRRVVAVAVLPRGLPIEAGGVRVEDYEGFPQGRRPLDNLEQVLGCLPRRPIAAGAPIWAESIETPPDVRRGDTVEVTVRCGAANLSLVATAETGGRTGETISVRNNDTKKLFDARVTGRGRVAVLVKGAVAEQ
jgi:flagella basal body P-ring formation protein FlgA